MKKLLAVLVGTFLLLLVAGSASAIPVTVDGSATGYVNAGTIISGSFDITPELTPIELYNDPYEVVSGNMSFGFTDDDSDLYYAGITYTDWSGTDNIWLNQTFYRDSYTVYMNENEEAILTVESTEYTNGTEYYTTEQLIGSTSYMDTDYIHFAFYTHIDRDTYITYNYSQEFGFTGEFTIETGLNEAQLYALSMDGILTYDIQMDSGDAILNSAVLNAEVNENPFQEPVPEPATILLLGSGLAGLLGINRKIKKGSSPN